ncbi:MAG: 3,4-dihydroxy-2-butanone-4-phosphate synthase [Bdellovibrionales bacterium]|jgi:3,4-dihydroxy 2-butanone 4-phosphate synthase/GTP cyclohydrolase II
MFILTDDEDRENEGDLVIAADFATPEVINFMAHFGCGLVCLAMAPDLVDRLNLPMMTNNNGARFQTAFTVSIEAREGVTTGISAFDRAHTIKTAIDPRKGPKDIVSPGHVFPLKANPDGVLGRRGQTEGSVDVMRLAGLTPAAVICEVMKDDGTMARMQDLVSFAAIHDMKIGTISDLAVYRQALKTADKRK